jgi:nucleotide-binding universal stress UspA family protein
MKTLLVATDFSANAKHAVDYAYKLAEQMQANLVLCNAFIVPAEMPDAGFVSWPMYEFEETLKDSEEELKALRTKLEEENVDSIFKPAIHCANDAGTVPDVINDAVEQRNVLLSIMATHGGNTLSDLVIGNHSRRMIDETTVPLLLVPFKAEIKAIKKVAFATDFSQPEKDLQIIYKLINLIRPLNAELLITHIENVKEQSHEFKKWLDNFLVELSNKADYPHIYYRLIKSKNADDGLNWLCESGHVDVLAMVHREHGLIANIFKGSHTQKIANHLHIPLLVFPERY